VDHDGQRDESGVEQKVDRGRGDERPDLGRDRRPRPAAAQQVGLGGGGDGEHDVAHVEGQLNGFTVVLLGQRATQHPRGGHDAGRHRPIGGQGGEDERVGDRDRRLERRNADRRRPGQRDQRRQQEHAGPMVRDVMREDEDEGQHGSHVHRENVGPDPSSTHRATPNPVA
jgi:hypothetical protein